MPSSPTVGATPGPASVLSGRWPCTSCTTSTSRAFACTPSRRGPPPPAAYKAWPSITCEKRTFFHSLISPPISALRRKRPQAASRPNLRTQVPPALASTAASALVTRISCAPQRPPLTCMPSLLAQPAFRRTTSSPSSGSSARSDSASCPRSGPKRRCESAACSYVVTMCIMPCPCPCVAHRRLPCLKECVERIIGFLLVPTTQLAQINQTAVTIISCSVAGAARHTLSLARATRERGR